VVVRSAAHDTEENRRGGSHPRSMAGGCWVGEAHHVGVVLKEVPAGMAQARDHLSLMLASAASADGRRLRHKGGRRGEQRWLTPDKATAAAAYRQEAVAACGQGLSGTG
jgi:hypothetical protein